MSLTGCISAVVKPVNMLVDRDLKRVEEMATKYNDVKTAECVKYLRAVLGEAGELADEDVDGLLSLYYKLKLMRESAEKAEDKFSDECGAVAADMLIGAARSVR